MYTALKAQTSTCII